MGAPRSRLTRLQTDVLAAFFQREQGFYLTGGGALAGYHLGHRETHDLDLFTLSPAMEDGLRALRDTARELGASLEEIRTAPEFRRILLTRGNESVVVDLVVEHAEQVSREKPAHGIVRVDPAEEILANKLCTLLGRSEVRDLVDVRALEGLGLSLEQALLAGQRKDGGLTPAQLAWVLSQITIGDEATIPGGVTPKELRDYLRGLVDRLARLAHP
ncbi:MAG TPA: nucleotidyl transferase AbiEii/AbiGii toxin family protein [Vicinamibacteria bacterium]|nr:nucleotidyl transferase AbiEii/AbiGii toxin family protein [Vicinamibacteria bacterium]